MIRATSRRLINKLQSMLTYNGCAGGTVDTENGSPAESILSGEGELPEEVGDSPGTSRDTEEEATLSDDFYSHDTDEEEEQQGKKRRDRNNSVSKILIDLVTLYVADKSLDRLIYQRSTFRLSFFFSY